MSYLIQSEDPLCIKLGESGEEITYSSHPDQWTEALMEYVRIKRSAILSFSDWTQAADVQLSPEKAEAWRAYRQAMRDLSKSIDAKTLVNLSDLDWPSPPE